MSKNESPDPASPVTEVPVVYRGEPGERRAKRSGGATSRRIEGKPRARMLKVGGRMAKIHGCAFGIDNLLEKSGSAKASLYSIYKSKDGLLAAICTEERVEYQRYLLNIDHFQKNPQAIIKEHNESMLEFFGSEESLIGVSLQVLLTAPAGVSRGGLPKATSAAALTLESFPRYLRDRLDSILDFHMSDTFEAVTQEYFKALLLAAVTPRLFPKEKPEKQAALLSAINTLADQISSREYAAAETVSVRNSTSG